MASAELMEGNTASEPEDGDVEASTRVNFIRCPPHQGSALSLRCIGGTGAFNLKCVGTRCINLKIFLAKCA